MGELLVADEQTTKWVRYEDYVEVLTMAGPYFDTPQVITLRETGHEYDPWYPGARAWGKPIPYKGACGTCGRPEIVHPTKTFHIVGHGFAADGSDLDAYQDSYKRADEHDHDWVDMRNEIVSSGHYCRICGKLK